MLSNNLAVPWDAVPKNLIRNRDSIYGNYSWQRVRNKGINEVLTALGPPWQNPYAERLTGPIRRECLNHVM